MWNINAPTAQYLGHTYPTLPTRPVTSPFEIQRVINEVYNSPFVAIDTETTGLVQWQDVPLYWSLAWGNQRATLHADLLPYFDVCFNNPNITWVLANAKYDMHILANYGHILVGMWRDVQVMHGLLFDHLPHRLKFIAQQLLNWTWGDFQDQFGKITKKQTPRQLIEKAEQENFGLLVEYAANDAWGTLKVYEALEAMLRHEATFSLFRKHPPYIDTLWDYFTKVESPFTRSLWKMERRGVKIDRARFAAAKPEAEKKLDQISRDMTRLAGFPLNPNSPAQVAKYMDSQGYKPIKWTKGGKYGVRKPSWDADVLEHYDEDPVVELILEQHAYSKLYGTYIVGLDEMVDPFDRIHSSFNQTPRTGRISSSTPNLQNLPRAENDHWNLRSAFIAEPGCKIIDFDFNQLEMRLLAAGAEEQTMVDIFLRGWDIHAGNAAMMFNGNYEDINAAKDLLKKIDKLKLSPADTLTECESESPGISTRATAAGKSLLGYLHQCAEDRTGAKSVGFGLNYGLGPKKLARQIKTSQADAVQKIALYKGTYPAVEAFMKESVEEGRRTGFAFTVMGRRRNIPMIASTIKGEQALGERLATNTRIQGCLPAHVRILTKDGYLPIKQAPELGIAWTGTDFAPYRKLDRGPSELAELHLSNGQTLDCDVRHKVLTVGTQAYEFKHFDDLREGDQICTSLARPLEFGSNNVHAVHMYWMGFMLGNAYTSKGPDHRNALSVTFGDRCNRYEKEVRAKEYVNYINQAFGIATQKPRVQEGKITIVVESAGVRQFYESLGYPWGKTAEVKTAPTTVWTACLEGRKSFLLGMLDADGHLHATSPNIHLCQRPLLHELLILFRTCGIEGTLRDLADGSYRLDLVGSQCARHLSYGSIRRNTIPMPAPKCVYKRFLTDAPGTTLSHTVLRSRVRRGGHIGVYTIAAMYENSGLLLPTLYASRALVRKERLGKVDTTYTLSVQDPGHRFDSEGVISQNSAAEVTKMAQLAIDTVGLDTLFNCHIELQVHDELVFECPEENVARVMPEIKELMEHPFSIDLICPLKVEGGFANSWGEAK